jgi:hypothetical protein
VLRWVMVGCLCRAPLRSACVMGRAPFRTTVVNWSVHRPPINQMERTLLCASALAHQCVIDASARSGGVSMDDAMALLGDAGVPALLDAVVSAARPFPGVGEVRARLGRVKP